MWGKVSQSIDQWISRNIRRLQGIEIKVEFLNVGILVEWDDISQLAVKRRNLYDTFGNRATQLVTDGCFWIEVHQCTPLDQKQWWRVHPPKNSFHLVQGYYRPAMRADREGWESDVLVTSRAIHDLGNVTKYLKSISIYKVRRHDVKTIYHMCQIVIITHYIDHRVLSICPSITIITFITLLYWNNWTPMMYQEVQHDQLLRQVREL